MSIHCWDKRPRAVYPKHGGGLRDAEVRKCTRTAVMLRNNCSLGVSSMSTWRGLFIGHVDYYNTGNAPIQLLCPKTRWRRGHYSLLLLIMISVLDLSQTDTYPLPMRPLPGRPPMTNDLLYALLQPSVER
jgi:hypothetical protein